MPNSPIPHVPLQSNPRRFSGRQRVALFLAADGHCSFCGVALSRGWHADHVDPFSRGGDTDVLNGQALCARCNLRKGNRVTDLRKWQTKGAQTYNQFDAQDFCCSATPGSGKTTFALEIARQELSRGRAQRLVVVVPTTNLKTQWCEAAAKVGISLDPTLTNRHENGETSDFHGCCVTYAQVGMLPDLHRNLCRLQTMVIFDEIHHAAEKRHWGDALRHAFGFAVRRLMLTGTPFREDGRKIPFIRYDDVGKCIAHVSYNYGDALKDGAVRSIVFPSYEGSMSWWSSGHGDERTEWTATFGDDIPLREESRRTKTALDPQGEWIRDVIRSADDRLQSIRKTIYPAAAGLLIASDQQHANAIARTMSSIIGIDPVVVTSDDKDASNKIDAFRKGGPSAARWIIAIRMVSEGVDIPRLFVGIWATNAKTELTFYQIVGRFVRMLPDIEDQTAYLFIPKLDYLIEYVEAIKKERDGSLKSIDEDDDESGIDRNDPTFPPELPDWAPYTSTAIEDATYIGDEAYRVEEMRRAREFIVGTGWEGANVEIAAQFIRRYQAWSQATAPAAMPIAVAPVPQPMMFQQRDGLKRKVRALVGRYMQARIDSGIEIDQKTIYLDLMRYQDGTAQADATIEQLKERIDILSRWIEEVLSVRR